MRAPIRASSPAAPRLASPNRCAPHPFGEASPGQKRPAGSGPDHDSRGWTPITATVTV